MYLCPSAHVSHHLGVQSLIAVLLWLVDEVDHAIRTFLVEIGHDTVNGKTLVLL